MREKSTRLELALSASQAGVCSWIVGSEEMTCDHRFRLLFGFESDARVTCDQVMDRMHPEDRRALHEMIAAIDLPGVGDHWNQELRIDHPESRRTLDFPFGSCGARFLRSRAAGGWHQF